MASLSLIVNINISPDGGYICAVSTTQSLILKKKSGNYDYETIYSSTSDTNFNILRCDISNSKVVFVGNNTIRIMNKLINGSY